MRIECVTVSVDCGDYLAHTLVRNKSLFDRTVVVTADHDEETKRICTSLDVECLVTDAFYRGGDKFNKGRAVQEALVHLKNTGSFESWMVHTDADIVLPPMTRKILESIPLNEQFLYGIDRTMCPSYEQWMRFVNNPLPQHEQAYVHPGPFPLGTRLMKLEQGGWVPLGFFQMFHRQASALSSEPWYPTDWDSAATSDLYFSYKWPRTHRQMLPEILAIHLDVDQPGRAMGHDWSGRRSARFEPRDPWAAAVRPIPRRDTNGQ